MISLEIGRALRRRTFPARWASAFPPTGTTVEIGLVEKDGATLLRLVHRGLPPAVVEDHERGWTYFRGVLRDALE